MVVRSASLVAPGAVGRGQSEVPTRDQPSPVPPALSANIKTVSYLNANAFSFVASIKRVNESEAGDRAFPWPQTADSIES